MPRFMNNRVDLGIFSFSWAVWEVVTEEIDLGHQNQIFGFGLTKRCELGWIFVDAPNQHEYVTFSSLC